MFTGLGNLEELHLNRNDITDIQAGTFNSTSQLRYLDLRLSDNNITTFPFDELSRLQRLYRLDLNNNQMTTLPSIAYNILSSISDVNIGNNPWQCDCRMVDVRLKMAGTYPFEDQITCSQPDHLNGRKLRFIRLENLKSDCEEPTIVRFVKGDSVPLFFGGTLHLICEATGIPTPEITVTLPSGLIATVESVGRVTVDMNGNIIIRNVTADDSGRYVCIAKNSVGSTYSVFSTDVSLFYPGVVVGSVADPGSKNHLHKPLLVLLVYVGSYSGP
ncbi:PREDICTED: immunoglobulin superfamily containing leucine-rich repeat protein-like [Branchiostoma belcheri]|uniref:Immunoglobulin superfamily containing leucine-rich repeat protein-like n=1 Tax=Branchiostoma belcheri TaxID=7741 RepID=A0A6P4ZJ67_BRABE|nr:PREDICTED: immunoglobulin superfamily containing leucine-rich repeat protein-like [Branchiostoma belcheri]